MPNLKRVAGLKKQINKQNKKKQKQNKNKQKKQAEF